MRFEYRPLALVGLLCLWVSLVAPGCAVERATAAGCSFDVEAIERADRAYATAWLTNDPDRVMATLTDDAVIMPSGMEAKRGPQAIRWFWWPPEGPPTTVTAFDLVQQEAGGDGSFAFVQGSFMLRFQMEGKSYSGTGEYLSLLKCLPGGEWRISHRIWNDLPEPSD